MGTLKTQFGIAAAADFEELTWTFGLPNENFNVTAGEFAILPRDKYENLITMLNKILSIDNAAFNLTGFDVERLKSEIKSVIDEVV